MSLSVEIRNYVPGFSLEAEFLLERGTLGLLGPSGCGKSMTLRCVAGVVTPDRGKIELDGVTWFD